MVGTLGSARVRCGVLTANAIKPPDCRNGSTPDMPAHMKSMRPAITSVSDSAPRNGTCTPSKPALTRSRSAAQWVALPAPAEA